MIAHRGASSSARENTIAAFRRAAELGADAVELDVRRTRDDVLVVHHDAVLPDGRALRAVQAAELPAYVPRLGEALAACGSLEVNVEIKNAPGEPDFDADDTIADATVAALLELGDSRRWLISSFRRPTIDRCRALAPELRTAWLCVRPPEGIVRQLVGAGHQAIHPYFTEVDEAFVDAAHGAGLQVNVWTCDDEEAMRRLAGWGVDGICTNVPDRALAALGR